MGGLILDSVVSMLNSGGIRAEAAYPAGRITRVTEPVAAVSLDKVDQKSQTVTVRMDILSPKESGGYICQKKALEACEVLESGGAVCCQEGCNFLSKANVFCVTVRAVFRGTARSDAMEELAKLSITLGTLPLNYACGFTAEQIPSDTGALIQNAFWKFTLEEFFPWGVMDGLEVSEPFSLELHHLNNVEQYANCRWTGKKRIAEETGLRQIRTGTAEARSLSVV